ncbi:hypothetical protein K469DRAFT_650660 [Zopfia rhizophila CBS 207.26]|uniref:Uncharacterized protein n=1 Tax=Zopfia rhizophila CBS 207.26 TaxID=1314779 RepID=A0A6A6EXS2_9PEZI|nr:hypothetical protein K469DRAFT_650660 [Zopfia rhizophila CBS 207.26]
MALEDPNLTDIKARHFLGIARLELDELSFVYAESRGHREPSEKVKKHLLKVFKREGVCEEEEHFINAIIDKNVLDLAIENAGLRKDDFRTKSWDAISNPKSIPRLKLNHPVDCLDGLHRKLAAKEYLDNNDQLWIVKLYSREGFLESISRRSIESFAHEQPYTDGTIFRKIRLYHLSGDKESEDRWWTRLTDTKKKDLRQLLNNNNNNNEKGRKKKSMVESFDALLDFPGLWTPIQLGTLHRLHGLKCTEELISYLTHIKTKWSRIVPVHLRKCVDTVTVQNLELYAPGVSKRDYEYVKHLMDSRKIFPLIDDNAVRESILESIRSIKCLIPSLRTFFQNQIYLEPCCSILRTLLGESEKRSLWRGFSANYFPPSEFRIECAEGIFKAIDTTAESKKALGYLVLWMFCLRGFPEMTSYRPKITPGKKKKRREYNPALWTMLGRLAVQLGFRTSYALELAKQNPDEEHSIEFLRTARPGWEGDIRIPVSGVVQILEGMKGHGRVCTENIYFAEGTLLRDQRCGMPHDDDHDGIKGALFAPFFYETTGTGLDITSLYVKRDLLKVFLQDYITQVFSRFNR